MKPTSQYVAYKAGGQAFEIRRTAGGVAETRSDDANSAAAAAGLAHGIDRMLQMDMLRLIGQGRLCECLQDSEESLAVDRFSREMGFAHDAAQDVENLLPGARDWMDAYCAGFNLALSKSQPWELKALGRTVTPWTPADALITYKLMSYIGLAQTQQDTEKLILQAIHEGVDPGKLRALFSPHLDGLTDTLVDLLKRTPIHQPHLGQDVRFGLPSLKASNNWVVHGSRTASGMPIVCCDPHLECNRLPAIWYEVVQHVGDDLRIGATMPGIPALVMGRTRHWGAGFTYGFMDQIDYFIEEIKDGRWRHGDSWKDLSIREENILRKKGEPVVMRVHDTAHGTLELPADGSGPENGLHLARAWSNAVNGASDGINATFKLLDAKTVEEIQRTVAEITISANWLIADSEGHIGYQQSGRLPQRAHSGLHPVPGWEPQWDWNGWVAPQKLTRVFDPPEGFLATANDNWNRPGFAQAINLHMGDFRAGRIRDELSKNMRVTVDHMKTLQGDLYSLQAERLLPLFLPHLPDNEIATLLKEWDRCYDVNSRGATVFEAIYADLLHVLFGEGLFGSDAWNFLAKETGFASEFFPVLDEAVLSGDALWFGAEGPEACHARVVQAVCSRWRSAKDVPRWGSLRRVDMKHLLFGDVLPGWLGFNHGPIELPGGRSTVVQGAVFEAHGRTTTFCPSWRMVADLSETGAWTVLAGGPSDRRFSPFYKTDIGRWLGMDFKLLGD